MENPPRSISLTINIDGLPIRKSSTSQFRPILFKIYELPIVRPQVVGIFCGMSKPSNANQFMKPFIDELIIIVSDGLVLPNDIKVNVRVRAFICDSPARAFVKCMY